MTITIDPDVIPVTHPYLDDDEYDDEEYEYPDEQTYPNPVFKP